MAAKHLIITLDGPAGAGKSTIAQGLARRLGITYLDTGAMYRALTLKALRLRVDLINEQALADLAAQTKIDFKTMPDATLHVTLDGEDVAEAIRSVEVTNNTFYAARAVKVREMMVQWQRAIAQGRSIVTDGRDQGSVVFPHADYKFYVDADFDERVRRRLKDLLKAGQKADEAQLRADMKDRDTKDFTRAVGPLKKAEGAIVVDSTGLTVDQTVEKILRMIK